MFTSAFLRVRLLCFSPGCISLHAALSFFLSIWFHSLRFGALSEFVFVYYYVCIFQEYEETCLFTKHESLQGDSPRVYPNILKCSLHSLVTKGIRLVGFATRAMVSESPTHYLILNSLAFARGRVILHSHFLILLLLIILISHYILPYFSLLQ